VHDHISHIDVDIVRPVVTHITKKMGPRCDTYHREDVDIGGVLHVCAVHPQ